MDFTFDQETRLLAEGVARHASQSRDEQGSPAAWREFAEAGWLGAPHSESCGGFGLGMIGAIAISDGLGAALSKAPYATAVIGAGGLVARCDDTKDRLAALIEGRRRPALGLFDSEHGYRLDAPGTTARISADGYVLSADKSHVLAATDADFALVSARLADGTGIALFEIPLDAAGVTIEPYRLADGREAARLVMCNVDLPFDARLACADASSAIASTMADLLTATAAENVAAMQILFDRTLDYAKTRRQFGRAIGSFQDLQFRLVDMWIKLDEARSLMMTAAMMLTERHAEAEKTATAAWIQSVWSSRLIAEEAIQIHGAIGMTEEYEISRYVKRILVNELLFGGADWHLSRLASATIAP